MRFCMEKLNFLLDYFVGNLPQTFNILNSPQTIGLAMRSNDGTHRNPLTTSIDDIIGCLENMLRHEVWEYSNNTFHFQTGVLTRNVDRLFQTLRNYNEPPGSSR